MVRAAGYRTTKYAAKMVGDVVKNRFDALHDSMVDQASNKFSELVAAEEAAKGLMNGWGISTTLVPFYLSWARQCYAVTSKHGDEIALEELCLKYDTWLARGLDPYYLQEVCLTVCSVDISSCTA